MQETQVFKSKPHGFKTEVDVVGCLCEWEDEVLMLRRSKTIDFPGTYTMPAGKVEPYETLKEAAFRELYEETGLSPDIKKINFYHAYSLLHFREEAVYRL